MPHVIPYVMKESEANNVANAKKNDTLSKWFHDSHLKTKIKHHCYVQQIARCCYCRQLLLYTNLRTFDLEHILPEHKYKQFLAEPRNLSIACVRCNGKKGDQDVLISQIEKKICKYPDKGDAFTIPHPYYDNYDVHIERKNDWYYIGLTSKGENLIRVCKLNEDFNKSYGCFKTMSLNDVVIACKRATTAATEGNHEDFLDAASIIKKVIEDARGKSLVSDPK